MALGSGPCDVVSLAKSPPPPPPFLKMTCFLLPACMDAGRGMAIPEAALPSAGKPQPHS